MRGSRVIRNGRPSKTDMKTNVQIVRGFYLSMCLFLALPSARALIMLGGTEPVNDPGWPVGAVAMANAPGRIGYWEGPPFGGGQYTFEFSGDATALNRALEIFAKIRAPSLELVVQDGPHFSPFIKNSNAPNEKGQIDWSFTVWIPANWHRLFNNPKSTFGSDQPNFRKPVDPPRLTVYTGGKVDWREVQVPPTLRVRTNAPPQVA
jgi:hypothetical protein